MHRFTIKAQEALQNAQELAAKENHGELKVIHLLISLVSDEHSLVRPLLAKAGVNLAALETALSEELKIPYREGLYTNPYRGAVYGHRTFIRPNGRERAAAEKYSILYEVIREYPRIILVDDSIVRGVTMKELVTKLRKAGAYEIHLRIASPPLKSGCYMGVDFGTNELFAAKYTSMEKRRKFLGVDSLVYLTPSELIEAVLGNSIDEHSKYAFTKYGFCGACFTGNYPIKIKDTIAKC